MLVKSTALPSFIARPGLLRYDGVKLECDRGKIDGTKPTKPNLLQPGGRMDRLARNVTLQLQSSCPRIVIREGEEDYRVTTT